VFPPARNFALGQEVAQIVIITYSAWGARRPSRTLVALFHETGELSSLCVWAVDGDVDVPCSGLQRFDIASEQFV